MTTSPAAFRLVNGVLIPTCNECVLAQLSRFRAATATSRGRWWCKDCLPKRCREIEKYFEPQINKAMDIKRRVMKAYEGETEQVGMTAQMKGEARAVVMKVARLSGLRDACVLQAAYGQYLPFQESSISPVSGAGRSLIEQWFEWRSLGDERAER